MPLLLCGLWLGVAPGAAKAEVQTITASAFAAELSAARGRVLACEQAPQNCDGKALPGLQQVQGAAAGAFQLDWQWLAETLENAKGASTADRSKHLRQAEAHLEVLGQEAGATTPPANEADLRRAHAAAASVLARGEFQAAEGPSWLERRLARLQDALLRLFTGMDRLGRRAPWLAPLVEWGCFALAAAGLLWSVRQSLNRQALRIALADGVALHTDHTRATDWAHLAEEQAAAAAWREAVHSLYWAAIALLESRRAWKPNSSRTPREYLRLLRPGSEAQAALRELTRGLERSWYGTAAVSAGDYSAALASFRTLEALKPERFGAGDASAVSASVPVAASA